MKKRLKTISVYSVMLILAAIMCFGLVACGSTDTPTGEKTLESIAIEAMPAKLAYNEGDAVDTTGLKVIATFSDASKVDVTAECKTSKDGGYITASDTCYYITYTYNGKTKSTKIDITVQSKVIASAWDSALESAADYVFFGVFGQREVAYIELNGNLKNGTFICTESYQNDADKWDDFSPSNTSNCQVTGTYEIAPADKTETDKSQRIYFNATQRFDPSNGVKLKLNSTSMPYCTATLESTLVDSPDNASFDGKALEAMSFDAGPLQSAKNSIGSMFGRWTKFKAYGSREAGEAYFTRVKNNVFSAAQLASCPDAVLYELGEKQPPAERVEKLEGLGVTSYPDKLAYEAGEMFDITGASVIYLTSIGGGSDITADCLLTLNAGGEDMNAATTALAAGMTKVKVSYTSSGITKTLNFPITVESTEKIISLEITPPIKTSYIAGENLETAGMVVKAVTEDGSKQIVTGYTYDKTGYLAVSDTLVTVTYRGVTGTFAITVVEAATKTLTGITITTAPDKTSYRFAEYASTEGMVVTARYSDATTAVVTDACTVKVVIPVEGSEAKQEPVATTRLTMDCTKLAVSYTEGGVVKTADINITVALDSTTFVEPWLLATTSDADYVLAGYTQLMKSGTQLSYSCIELYGDLDSGVYVMSIRFTTQTWEAKGNNIFYFAGEYSVAGSEIRFVPTYIFTDKPSTTRFYNPATATYIPEYFKAAVESTAKDSASASFDGETLTAITFTEDSATTYNDFFGCPIYTGGSSRNGVTEAYFEIIKDGILSGSLEGLIPAI